MSSTAKIISRKFVFNGYQKVEEIVCQPKSLKHDGYTMPMSREVFQCGQSAAILLYCPETDELLLNQQFRLAPFVAGDENPFLYECAAGGVDKGEAPEAAALREALEETGHIVTASEFICRVYPSASRLGEETFCYVGRIGRPAAGFFGAEEDGEDIKTHVFKVEKAIEMLDGGQITNAIAALALNWFARHHDRLKAQWT